MKDHHSLYVTFQGNTATHQEAVFFKNHVRHVYLKILQKGKLLSLPQNKMKHCFIYEVSMHATFVPPCICATSSSPHFYPRTPHCTKAKAKAYSHSLTVHASHLLTVATIFPGAHGYSCSNRRSAVSSLNKLMPFQENLKAGEYQCQSYQRLPLIHNYHSQTSFPLSRYHYDVKEFGQSSSTKESTSPVCDGKTW